MSNSADYAIEVETLSKRYGDLLAVNKVSFHVNKGEMFAFLGPNGAGKTTTVEIIETIRTPTSGRVSVFGMDVAKHKRDILPRIGVLPQGFNSFDRLTVSESIQYYARLFGNKTTDVDGLMDLADLKDKRDVQFKKLSSGLKQRLGIAIALVNDPEVLFLDEPTTGLDPHARRAVWDVLLGLKRKGKLVALGSPGELIQRHADYMWLRLKSVDAGAVETIKKMSFAPVLDSHNNLKVQVKDANDVQKILSAIKLMGMVLPGLDVRKPNLEEVFLSLTGEELHAGALTAGDAQ